MPARYFLRFSYIGTGFRGSCKSVKDGMCHDSVQGNIELGLLNLRPNKTPIIAVSSRTDAGVHALQSTAHVDLETVNGNIYNPNTITRVLNKYLKKNNKAIVIHDTKRVNPDFHARFFAKSRTYLYRLAVLKNEESIENLIIPIEEKDRLHVIKQPNFDIERVKESIKLFEGEHDFETFKKSRKGPWKPCRRIIYSADINKGMPMLTTFTLENSNSLDYWDFKFRANGYLYNQIRRIVGALIKVGYQKLNPRDIVTMLQIPNKNSWPSGVDVIPPHGLYLCSVEYDEKDLIYE